jgi:plasmid stability protein
MLTEDLHRKIRVTAAAYGTSMEDQVYRLLERTDWEDVAVKKGRGPP